MKTALFERQRRDHKEFSIYSSTVNQRLQKTAVKHWLK